MHPEMIRAIADRQIREWHAAAERDRLLSCARMLRRVRSRRQAGC